MTLPNGCRILVDHARPAAVVRCPDRPDLVAAWPDLDVGALSPDLRVVPGPDGVWVRYAAPSGDDAGPLAEYAPTHSAAVHIDPDGRVSRVMTPPGQVLGATRHGLWVTSSTAQRIDDDYRGGALPPGWSEPTEVTVHDTRGGTTTILADRRVLSVREDGEVVRVIVAPTPPVAEPQGSGFSYRYGYAPLTFEAAAPLAPVWRVGPLLAAAGRAASGVTWDGETWDDARLIAELHAADPSPGSHLTDLGPAGEPWDRHPLPAGAEQAAVDALVGEFSSLDSYWRDERTGRSQPLVRGLRESRVHVAGQWPDTEVQVEFALDRLPETRLRRRSRVFDDAGRIIVHMFASIHLMEDLDTGTLPTPAPGRTVEI